MQTELAGRFLWFCRAVLSIGFLAPGLTKALGRRFTLMPVTDAVGFFFEGLYRTGLYWRFLGVAQIAAALLILYTPTAPLSGLLFFVLTLNIFVITISLPFAGTPWITGAMLLASLYLVAYEYPRWKTLLPGFRTPSAADAVRLVPLSPGETGGLRLFVIGGMLCTLPLRDLTFAPLSPVAFLIAGLACAAAGGVIAAFSTLHLLWRRR